MAIAAASATVMIRCHVAVIPPISTPPLTRNGVARGVVGFQMVVVIPMNASMRPTVTTSCTITGA